MKNMMDYDFDSLLDLVGLSRRPSSPVGTIFAAAGFVALGAAVGAAAGLAFAPSSGQRFRKEVGDRFDQIRERVIRSEQRHKNPMNAVSQHS